MKNFNLSNVINQNLYVEKKGRRKAKIQLSDKQRNGFVYLFGTRCRSNTITALRKAANDNFRRLKSYEIFERVKFEGDMVSYCSGQDRILEKASIRKFILEYY